MDILTPRGMRDFSPEEKLFRESVIATLKRVFARYGFSPLETPVVERYDVLSAKYAGGAEILKETFRFTDQGGRELGLRYDLTVPLARYVALHADVKLPFKRYQIEKVYRDGPIKQGRVREFYQCDCDIVGAPGVMADAQCLQLGLAVFAELGIEATITCNDIGLLKAMLLKDGVQELKLTDAMLILDKLKKIGKDGVEAELREAGIPPEGVAGVLAVAGGNALAAIRKRYGELPGLARMEETLSLVPGVVFDPSLSRGLAYYTGIVFEAYSPALGVSLSGGGRYDRMIGGFLDRPDDFPAVGISFGLEPIMEVLKDRPRAKTLTDAFVCPIKTEKEASALAEKLRREGLNVDVDLMGRGVSKNLDYASALGIPFVIFIGPREIAEGKCKLRDMRSGEETLLRLDEVPARVRSRDAG